MNGVILLLAREKLVSFHRNQERKIQRVLILMIWVDFFGTMFRYSGFSVTRYSNRRCKTVLHRVDPSEHFLPIFRGENYPPALQNVTHYTPGPVLDRLRLRFV